MTPLRQRMLEELQLRNLSETTIHTYLRLVERFAKHFGASPAKLGPDQVRQYLLHLLNDRKDTWATVQVNRGALKFLYVRVLKQSWFDEEIAAPKRRPRLPTVMSPEEIARIAAWLAPPEHARAARFGREGLAQRYVAGRALLRWAITGKLPVIGYVTVPDTACGVPELVQSI